MSSHDERGSCGANIFIGRFCLRGNEVRSSGTRTLLVFSPAGEWFGNDHIPDGADHRVWNGWAGDRVLADRICGGNLVRFVSWLLLSDLFFSGFGLFDRFLGPIPDVGIFPDLVKRS